MRVSEGEFEAWWNDLAPQYRREVLRQIAVHNEDQLDVFSLRRWHELHGWMRNDLRKLHLSAGDLQSLWWYLCCEVSKGRGNRINDIVYIVIGDSDRDAFPELRECYAVAVEALPTTAGRVQHWLFTTEAQYDDEILLALSAVGLSSPTDRPHQ